MYFSDYLQIPGKAALNALYKIGDSHRLGQHGLCFGIVKAGRLAFSGYGMRIGISYIPKCAMPYSYLAIVVAKSRRQG